jgi:hypothetical protein
MGEWLRDRRNALIDGALFYVGAKWVMPAAVAAVLYLTSSQLGSLALFASVTVAIYLGLIFLAVTREWDFPIAPGLQDAPDGSEYVYVERFSGRPPIGLRGVWIRVDKPKDVSQP